jgi:hypothetical protein
MSMAMVIGPTPPGTGVISDAFAATGFVLETSSTLSSSASWTALTNGVATVGDQYVLTNNVSEAAVFYRLSKP